MNKEKGFILLIVLLISALLSMALINEIEVVKLQKKIIYQDQGCNDQSCK
jgi:hypothetical protein